MKQIEQLHIDIEEFRTKIKNVLGERLIELTDEGYSSEFWMYVFKLKWTFPKRVFS